MLQSDPQSAASRFFYPLALPAFHDTRGRLFSLESDASLPFALARVYWIVPATAPAEHHANQPRGFHAHKKLQQVMVCVQGSCRLVLDNATQRQEISLNDPTQGLYIGPRVWREIHDISPDCILMVLADQPYQPEDYIHDYAAFVQWCQQPTTSHQQLPTRPVARPVLGRRIRLRPIRVDEADFVLQLRLSEKSSRHLSTTTPDLAQQRQWLSDYKQREAQGQEHYFVIEDHQGERFGLVRLYDLQPESLSWGSWLMRDDAPTSCAIESALLVYEYAFGFLGYAHSHFDVRKNNPRVIAFHQRFGAEISAEDEDNLYFTYTLESYRQTRQRYQRYLPTSSLYGL